MVRDEEDNSQGPADESAQPRNVRAAASGTTPSKMPTVPLCWPFPPGSQNHTDKAVKLKPYVPPKRRSLNQY